MRYEVQIHFSDHEIPPKRYFVEHRQSIQPLVRYWNKNTASVAFAEVKDLKQEAITKNALERILG